MVAEPSVEELLRDSIDRGQSSGVDLLVRGPRQERRITLGRPSHAVDDDRPLADLRWDIASVSKTFTTACLMRLHDVGELDLETAVSRYLVEAPAEVTVRDLLAHRGGLWEWQPLYARVRSAPEAYRAIGSLELRYPRGAGRHYSDLGMILLGGVIERITAQRLDGAVRELVTDPLGLHRTGYGPIPAGEAVATAHGDAIERRMIRTGEPYPIVWQPDPLPGWTHVLQGEVADGNAHHAMGGVSGHAGIFTTTRDLTHFGAAMVAPGFVGEQTWSTFLQPGPDQQALGWWWDEVDGARVFHHPGFTGARLTVVPERGLVIVLLSNRVHTPPGAPIDAPPDIAPWWLQVRRRVLEEERAAY